jgi:hypothetical protein
MYPDRSVSFSETPERDTGRQIAGIIRIFTDQVPKPLERLPANGHVVVRAASIPDTVPDLIEAVGLLKDHAQLPAVHKLQRLPDIQELAVTAVKGEQLIDGRALGKA